MRFLNKILRKQNKGNKGGLFAAQIIFECECPPENQEKVKTVIEEFIELIPEQILEEPKIIRPSDGTVAEIMVLCSGKEEALYLNKQLEKFAHKQGLR